jgi:hypothetical protein
MSFDQSKGFEYWGGKKPQPPSTESTPLFSASSSLTIQTSVNEQKQSDSHTAKREEEDSNDESTALETGTAAAAGEEEEPEQEQPQDDGDDQQEEDVDDTLQSNSVSNGEFGEECLLQMRVKLFRFRVTEVKSEWVEMGVGPLKLLRPSSTDSKPNAPSRIVMRRENDRRGSGTKLLVNILLSATATTGRQAEKAVRLTCFTEEEVPDATGAEESTQPKATTIVPTSYLFKTESVEVQSFPLLI